MISNLTKSTPEPRSTQAHTSSSVSHSVKVDPKIAAAQTHLGLNSSLMQETPEHIFYEVDLQSKEAALPATKPSNYSFIPTWMRTSRPNIEQKTPPALSHENKVADKAIEFRTEVPIENNEGVNFKSLQDITENSIQEPAKSPIINYQKTFASERTLDTNNNLESLTHQNTNSNAPEIEILYNNNLSSKEPIEFVNINRKPFHVKYSTWNGTWTTSPMKNEASKYWVEVTYDPKDKTTKIIEYNDTTPIQETAYGAQGQLQSSKIYNANKGFALTEYNASNQPTTTLHDARGNNLDEPLSLTKAVMQQGPISGGATWLLHPTNLAKHLDMVADAIEAMPTTRTESIPQSPKVQEAFNKLQTTATNKAMEYAADQGIKAENPIELANKVTQIGVQKLGNAAQEYLKSKNLDPVIESKPSIFNQETIDIFNKTAADIKTTAIDSFVDRANKYIELQYGKPENQEVLQQRSIAQEAKGKKLAHQPLLTKTNNINKTSSQLVKSEPVKTSSMQSYLSDAFTKNARTLSRSPQNIKNFVTKIANTLSSLIRLTKEENVQLQSTINTETNSIINNKNNFTNADPRTFSVKFNTWIKSFVDKCYTAVGKKARNDVKIISIQEQSANPLSPRIVLTTGLVNKQNAVQSAFVTYNNKTYRIDPTLITMKEDGSISIENLQIFADAQPQTFMQKGHEALYNSTVKNTIFAPFKKSSLGQKIGETNIDPLQESLLVQPKAIKELSIQYHRDKSVVIKKTNLTTKVISEKLYDNTGSLTKEHITMPTDPVNIFMPAIEITYDLDAFLNSAIFDPASAIDINISSHTNPITGKESMPTISKQYDATTGLYRIEVSYKVPEADANTITTQVMQNLIDNQLIIKDSATATQVQNMLDTIIPILSRYPEEQYAKIVDNFETILDKSGYTGATVSNVLKNTIPQETIQTIKGYLKASTPTSNQSIIVEYNPETQQIAKKVVTRMSHGNPQATPSTIYSLD